MKFSGSKTLLADPKRNLDLFKCQKRNTKTEQKKKPLSRFVILRAI